LYANLLERLGFFLPQLSILAKVPARKPWRLTGKLYRSKVEDSSSSKKSKSIYTLTEEDRCWVKSEGALIEASACFEQILGKLTLMFAGRQTFGIEGVCWGDELVKAGSVSFGGEAESVILEVNQESCREEFINCAG
jgi:hypothetical protein